MCEREAPARTVCLLSQVLFVISVADAYDLSVAAACDLSVAAAYDRPDDVRRKAALSRRCESTPRTHRIRAVSHQRRSPTGKQYATAATRAVLSAAATVAVLAKGVGACANTLSFHCIVRSLLLFHLQCQAVSCGAFEVTCWDMHNVLRTSLFFQYHTARARSKFVLRVLHWDVGIPFLVPPCADFYHGALSVVFALPIFSTVSVRSCRKSKSLCGVYMRLDSSPL